MELHARISHLARPATMTVALGAMLALLAGTTDADAAKRKRYPVVTSVSPMNAKVGDTITIRGRYFIRGKNKNSVVFKRDGARAVFAKKTLGTAKQIRVVVPESLRRYLTVNVPTRVRLRVLSRRFGKKFTSASKSPRITALPVPAASTPGSTPASTPGGTPASTPGSTPAPTPSTPAPLRVCTGDEDGDMLAAALENALGLDACSADSDGDGVEDGYEVRSAQDWNDDEYQSANTNLPYPGKRPYPNALDRDAAVDHDGDTLTLKEEFDLWKYTIAQGAPRTLSSLTYSAGEQYSVMHRDPATGRRVPDLAAAGYAKQAAFLTWATGAGYATVQLADPGDDWFSSRTGYDIRDLNRSGGAPTSAPVGASRAAELTYYDHNHDLKLSDEERDEDADGLTNFDETRGCMNRSWWDKLYDKETPYYLSYSGTRLDDSDSDGDGVRDGADDADHDDLPNLMECSRNMASNEPFDPRPAQLDPPVSRLSMPEIKGMVNPFNPCQPSTTSRSCNQHPSLTNPWAPYNPDDKYFYVWN